MEKPIDKRDVPSTEKPYRILLYYKFVRIEDPEQFAADHLQLCQDLELKGRILVAEEGLNGTVSGTIAQTEQYMETLHADPRFADMAFKIDEADGHAFRKLFVRPRKEIVTFRKEDVDAIEKTGKFLSPKEFHELLQDEDVIVLDGRNDYEYDLGHFRNAIRPDVRSFREFPEWIRENLSEHKDKTILTYCTGGIRCEKLTSFMLDEGFENVAQLEGGIVTYGKDPEVKGSLWDGKCYVFDERIAVPINQAGDGRVVGKCYHCGTSAEKYINCAYDFCHRQHIVCPECEEQHQSFCSPECEEKESARVEG